MDSWPDSLLRGGRRPAVLGRVAHLDRARPRVPARGRGSSTTPALLEGKTIGIIRTDTAEQEETVDDALKPGLEDLGYEVAAEAVLPCPEGSADLRAARRRDPDGCRTPASTSCSSPRRRSPARRPSRRRQNLGFEPAVGDDRQQRHRHGRPVLRQREGQLRRRMGHRHRVHGLHRRRPPSATRSRSPAAPRSSPTGPTATASPPSRACSSRRSSQAIEAVDGDDHQATVIEALEELEPRSRWPAGPTGIAERRQARRRRLRLPLPVLRRAAEEFEPIDDEKPIEVGD